MSRVIEAELHRVLRRRGEVRFADAPVLATRGTRRAERRAYREALAVRIREAIASGEIKNKAEAARILRVSGAGVAKTAGRGRAAFGPKIMASGITSS
jgi:hypothetical protein